MKITDITEAVNKVPKDKEDVNYIKSILNKPLPAAYAIDAISRVIIDDGLSDELMAVANLTPNEDVRPVIASWIQMNMPDLLSDKTFDNEDGNESALSGHPDLDEYLTMINKA